MITRQKPIKYILIDINTQRDFLLADGVCCIRNHRRILARIRRIMAWARHNEITVISLCEVHPSNSNCEHRSIDGTNGQRKIRYTLLHNQVSFAASDGTDLPINLFRSYRQVIMHMRCVDPFEEPLIERLLTELRANGFILIGASAEGAVMETALGLLQQGKNVIVVVDAVGHHDKKEGGMALRKMQTKGAKMAETKQLAGVSHLQQVGICHCDACKRGTKQQLPSSVLVGV